MIKHNFNVSINNKNGNIEHFFNLIKDKKINILEFDIFDLLNKYIDYLNKNLSNENIDVFSSNIFLLSYLILIRTKIIIPKETVQIDNLESEENVNNFELKRKLIEYKKFKDLSLLFRLRKDNCDKFLSKKNSNFQKNNNASKVTDYSFDLTLLTKSFKKIANNFNEKSLKTTTIENKILEPELLEDIIIEKLQNILDSKTLLTNLVESIMINLQYLICIFLAILNLAKRNIIHLTQNEKEIFIELIR